MLTKTSFAFCPLVQTSINVQSNVFAHVCLLRRQRPSILRVVRCTSQQPGEITSKSTDHDIEEQPTRHTLESDVISQPLQTGDAARAILDDVAANPQYYLNVSGVFVGLILSIIVLSATMVALDSLPVVPDVLRMVGLIYLFWFLAKFLFSASERQRLTNEVDEFVASVRGGEFRVIKGTEKVDHQLLEGEDRS